MYRTEEDRDDAEAYALGLASLPIDRLDVAQPRLFQLGMASLYFERLRREAPVHYCDDGMLASYWSITRHRDIQAIERDPATFSSGRGVTIASEADGSPFFPALISMYPPRHAAHRSAVAPAFAPERLDRIARRIKCWSQEILDGLSIGEPFDWADRVSAELASRALALLLSFPQERARDLVRWSDAAAALAGSPTGAATADRLRILHECFLACDAIRDERACEPRDDVISMLACDPATRDMPPREFHANLAWLIIGGGETVRNSLSDSAAAFHPFPHELEKLRAEPALASDMAAEVVRWQTPVAHMRRTAARDAVFGGKTIRQGDKVILWYFSGNRDEATFKSANEFLVNRRNARQHLAMGAGIHRCVGARLARLQLRTLWEEMVKQFARVEVVRPRARTFSTFTHGYSELWTLLPARSTRA